MEVLHPRCAGLDVHKDTVVACVRIAQERGVHRETRTFATHTKDLLSLSAWLTAHEVTHVAMEATGVYWRPVWHVLESSFELLLANAMHIKNVPGRKTDVNDATWIADLLAHGLIQGSFVPPEPVQELRALTRTRKQLVREKASHVQRVDKVLQDANLKLGSVLTDIMGSSGRAILNAIVAGETDPEKLVGLVDPRVKASKQAIREALCGRITKNHRFLLELHLAQIDSIDSAVSKIDAEVGESLEPFRAAADLVATIPGVSEVAASVIISEIGADMARFPSAAHLVSWAGLCPRNDQSAGKHRSTRTRKSAPWLKPLLVQCAWAAGRTKKSYLGAQFRRLKTRRGPKKAILAVAASILTAIYHMLNTGQPWSDLGADYFDRADKQKLASRLVRKLGDLGFQVDVKEAA